MISICLIIPAAYRVEGNALAVQLGYDEPPGNTYSVPLSASGESPATHYGSRSWGTPGFVAMLQTALTGIAQHGMDQSLATSALWLKDNKSEFLAALVFDVRETDDPYSHWADILIAHGLKAVNTQVSVP